MGRTIWTIGHSTDALDAFLGRLKAHGVRAAVDVRMYPGSRRHPQFSRESLERSLPEAGLAYAWLGRELGGRRRVREDSRHVALRNASFRGFADYMDTEEFSRGVDLLLELAGRAPTAFFCAERLWWRCHRSMIADYLAAARGWEVRHIIEAGQEAKAHKTRAEAHLEDGRLVYAEPELFRGR